MLRRRRNNEQVPNAMCEVHQLARVTARCKECRRAHCYECVVYPFGIGGPVYCIPCALIAAGVRRR